MEQHERREERAELISRLFALITAKLEDAAALAAECQGKRSFEELRGRAEQLDGLVVEAATTTAAASMLLRD